MALCALVEHIKPGSCPQFSTLSAQNGLANCELGIRLAEEHFGIPRILEAAVLNDPDVDELSVMTYISFFCKPVAEKLMLWMKSLLQGRNITNLTTDWNNGIYLAYLVDAMSPGSFPNWSQLNAADAVENLTKAMDAAERQLQVKPFIKASQMADPTVDELNQSILLLRLQAVYKPAQKIVRTFVCSGPGLTKATVGKPANFQVDGAKLPGEPKISAIIGQVTSLPVSIAKQQNGVFQATYTPNAAGKLSLDIKWEGAVEQNYNVEITDPVSLVITCKYFMPGQLAKIGQPVVMEAKGLQDVADLSVKVQHQNGKTEVAKVVSKGAGTAEVSYTPVVSGTDEIIAQWMGETVTGSPFKINVIDPSQCSVSAMAKFLIIMKETSITISGSSQGLKASVKVQNRERDLSIVSQSDGTSIIKYTPTEVGQHTIFVTCEGEHIKGSPLTLPVSDPSKCILVDSVPKHFQLGTSTVVKVGTKGAGPGQLECTSSNTAVVTVTITKEDQDYYLLKIVPIAVGEAKIHLTWAEVTLLLSPITVYVCDASQCSAYGRGLTSGVGKIGEQFDFTVKATRAGPGELIVKVQGPKSVYTAKVIKTTEDINEASFVLSEVGQHTIDVRWAGFPIPNSPFKIDVIEGADLNQFTFTSDKLGSCIVMQPVKCVLVGPVGDLFKNGLLQVKLRGQGFESRIVAPSEFRPVATEVLISIFESKKGTYEILYYTPKPGDFSLSITIDGMDIPGSPFQMKSLPSSDASRCKCYGSALDNRRGIMLGTIFDFNIDLTGAGTGTLTARAVNCNCKISIAQQEGKIYIIKLEPREGGVHTIEVLWDDVPVPGSPFMFTVIDVATIVVSDLPGRDYLVRVGVPFTFGLTLGDLDSSLLKSEVRLSDGSIEAFVVGDKLPNGTVRLSYTPKTAGEMEILLSYAQVNLLKAALKYIIFNLSQFQVALPTGYCRIKDSVKFTVVGLKQADPKLSITAAHGEHDVAVKVIYDTNGSAVAQFAPKQLGEYVVSVMYANFHISGSPFSIFVSDPDACVIISPPPAVVHIREMASIIVDTNKAGPGELACNPASSTKDLVVPVKIVKNRQDSVLFSCDVIGTSNMVVTWAGYPIPSSSHVVNFVDASKAKWTCQHSLEFGTVVLGESVSFAIDCSQSGEGKPEFKAVGPNGTSHSVEVGDDTKKGFYTAALKPSQLGRHEVQCFLAGKSVGAKFEFDVIANISLSSFAVVGESFSSLIARKPSEVVVHVSEAGLIKKGLLTLECTSDTIPKGDPRLPKLTVQDNNDGTYLLQILAPEPGQYLLHINWFKKPISGSPFVLAVKSRPDASKCIASGKFLEKTTVLVGVPVEFAVDTTDAGQGQLVVVATDPQQRAVRVSVTEDSDKRALHRVKFVPKVTGSHAVSVTWDGVSAVGSPFKFNAIDPSKCILSQFPKGPIPLGQTLTFTVDINMAGTASLVVMVKENSNQAVVLKPNTPASNNVFEYRYKATKVGNISFDISFSENLLNKCPLKIVVVDPSQCSLVVKDPSPGKPLVVNKEATLSLTGSNQDVVVIAKSPSSEQKLSTISQNETLSFCQYTPAEIGHHTIIATCSTENVRGSPLDLVVIDPTMCILNTVPKYVLVGTPTLTTVATKGAGPGQLECSSSNASVAVATASRNEQDLYSLKINPVSIGEATVRLTWAEYIVPPSPFTVYVCDTSQCSAYGRGLTSGVGKTGEPFEFTVKATRAGPGELSVKVQGPKAMYMAKVKKTSSDTYNISFVTSEFGQHMIDVSWAGFPFPNSPFKVDFTKRIDASSFTTTGSGAATCIALRPAKCLLVGTVGDLLKSGLLQVKLSGEGFESKTVGPSELKPVATQALVSIVEVKKGTYEIQYCTPKAGHYILSITIDEVEIQGSPFQIQSLPSPDASQCSFYGSAFESRVSHVLGKTIEFKVDLMNAGTGVLTARAINGNCKIFITQEEDRVYSIRLEPKEGGQLTIEVLWDDAPIPGSPFSFTVVDTASIGLGHILSSKDYVSRVGEPFVLTINLGSLDISLLKAEVKLNDGKMEPLIISDKLPDGTVKLTYIPKDMGEFQLLLSYAQINLLKSVLKYSSVNASLFKVTAPAGYCHLKDNVKFTVSGLQQGDQKLSITAVHKAHEAAVKISYDGSTATAQFAPKQLGEYVVSVMYANHHISGSPFFAVVTDPDACVITSPPPAVVHVKDLATLIVDTSKAGPGELLCSPVSVANSPAVVARIVKNKQDCCVFSSDTIGTSDMVVTWAGYPFASSSLLVNFVDASKAKWTCGHPLDHGVVILGESVPFVIDCSQCGQGKPVVEAVGPSGRFVVQVDEDRRKGFYNAVLKPSELGKHDVVISLAGKTVEAQVEFEVIKNVLLSSLTLGGEGIISVIAGKLYEVKMSMSESGLMKRGFLEIECTSNTIPKGDPRLPKLILVDNNDNTYILQILGPEPGQYSIHMSWLKKPLSGSPFTLVVRPRPDASKCVLSGKFTDMITVLVAVPVEFSVDTTDAGYGTLDVVVTDPLQKTGEVASVEERGKRTLHRLKFVPKIVGIHTVTLTWDGVSTPGSPLKVNAIDPSKCIVSQFPTGVVPLGQVLMFTVDTQLAGNAAAVVTVTENSGQPVPLKATNPNPMNIIYEYRYKTTKVGNVFFDISFSEHRLSGSPFKVVVVDPSQCNVSIKDPPPGKALLVSKELTLSITGSMLGVHAMMKAPTRELELPLIPQKEGLALCKYITSEVGQHTISVVCGGENVHGSPLNIVVINPAMCVLSSVPRYLLVGTPAIVTITTKGAGPGQLECASANTSIVAASLSKNEQDLHSLQLVPSSIGEASVSVTWGQCTVPTTPFTVYVCDTSQCSAYGRGLTSGVGKTGEQFDFTVKATRAGPGELIVKVQGPKSVYTAKLTKTGDETYNVTFTTPEIGQHLIDVRWAGFSIPNSPFKVDFTKRIDASSFTTTGSGAATCIALRPAKCSLVGTVGDLLKSGLLHVKLSGEGFESKTVGPSELKPVATQALVSIVEVKKGTYEIQYCTPKAGHYILSVIVDELEVPGSPFRIQSLPAPEASQCKYYGSVFGSASFYLLGMSLEFKVDLTNAGTGTLTAKAINCSCKIHFSQQTEKLFVIRLEPQEAGLQTIEVLWDDVPIPGSPFSFTVVDIASIVISDLPGKDYVARVGVPFTFSMNLLSLDVSLLKAEVKHSNGVVEPLVIEGKHFDGVVTMSYTPRDAGEFQLLLSYSQVNLLQSILKYSIVNMSSFHFTAPTAYCRLKENVKFAITGVRNGDQNVIITATHKGQDTPVKISYENNTAVVHFSPKNLGEYIISMLYSTYHFSGSPFSINVTNPDACIITSTLPKMVHVGETVTLAIDTSKTGPGELGCNPVYTSKNLGVQVRVENGKVLFSCDSVGTCDMVVTWAGYPIPSCSFSVHFVDASKAMWSCGHSLDCGVVTLGESLTFTIDCSQSGLGAPEVNVVGPKGSSSLQADENKRKGIYLANLKPSHLGRHEVTVTLAGRTVGAVLRFGVIKNFALSSFALVGEGMISVIAEERTQVTLHAPEPGLVKQGLLAIECTSATMPSDDPQMPRLSTEDNDNATYVLHILASVPGQYLLNVFWLKKPIVGSPFTLLVRPRPDASKCILSTESLSMATVLINSTVEFSVDTTEAGYGRLGVVITDHEGQSYGVSTVEKQNKRTSHSIRFEPKAIGCYTVHVTWEAIDIPGSPFQFNVVDPTKCVVTQFPKGAFPRGQIAGFTVDTRLAGSAIPVVMVTDNSSQKNWPLQTITAIPINQFEYRYQAISTGVVFFDVLFCDCQVSGSPFKLQVVDPTQCTMSQQSPAPGTPLTVNKEVTISITGNTQGLNATVRSPGGREEVLTIVQQGAGVNVISYTPTEVGSHTVQVSCGVENVKGSPLNLVVTDPAKCVLNSVPKYLHIGAPITVSISTKGAGPGQFVCTSSKSSVAVANVTKDSGQDAYSLVLNPVAVGETIVNLTWAGSVVPTTPFTVYVCDSTQCKAYGRGLTLGAGRTGELFEFTVKVIKAGPGELAVKPQGPRAVQVAKVVKADDGSYNVSFVTTETGQHMVDIKWAGVSIPDSPYKVEFTKRVDISSFSVTLSNCITLQPASCALVGIVGDLLKSGLMQVKLSGQGYESKLVGPSDVKPVTSMIPLYIAETRKGTYEMQYCTPKAGEYKLNIVIDETPVPGSPFLIQSLAPADASKCKCYGGAIDNRTGQIVGKAFEFSVDVSNAGSGKLIARAISGNCKISVTQLSEKVYSIKIEPKASGEFVIEVLWDDKPVPWSPVTFTVADPATIHVIDLPNPKDHVARVGDLFTFRVKLGNLDASLLKAEAKLSGGRTESFTMSEKQSDGEVKLSYFPKEAGEFQLLLSYSQFSLFKSVMKYPVANQLRLTVTPPSGYCRLNENAEFVINGLKPGDQRVSITAVNGAHNAAINIEYRNDDTAIAQFSPNQIGMYQVSVIYNSLHVNGSPFSVPVSDPESCSISSPLPKVVHVGDEASIVVDTSKAGPGELFCRPVYTSKNLGVQVTTEQRRAVFSSSVVGTCEMLLSWAGYSFPGSSFAVSFVDASKAKWSCEKDILNSTVVLGETVTFTIDCSESGQGASEVNAVGPNGPYVVQVGESGRKGIFLAVLTTSQLGKHTVRITLAGKVIGTLIEFQVINAAIEQISSDNVSSAVTFTQRQSQAIVYKRTINTTHQDGDKKYALISDLFSFDIDGKFPGVDSLSSIAHGPSSDIKLKIVQYQGQYRASFTPVEAGAYEVYVDYAKTSVSGTPFTLNVVDPSKCQVLGEVPTMIQVGTMTEFVLKTRGAGPGNLTYSLGGSSSVTCDTENQGQDTYVVHLTGKKVGVFELSLLWGGYSLPHFPVRVSVCDAKQCKILGQVVATRSGNVGEPVTFTVTHQQAGEATLSVTVNGPTAQCNVDIVETSPFTHEVTFIPWELGEHSIHVNWGAEAVPESPLSIFVGIGGSTMPLIAVGPGLKTATARKEAAFTIISGQLSTGLYSSGALKVSVTAIQVAADVDVFDNNNGCYTVKYFPPAPGAYLVAIMLNDKNVAGGPFKVNVISGSDASKCRAYGSAFARNAILFSGNPIDFSVDCKDSGSGKLTVEAQGPQGFRTSGYVTDEGNGQYIVKCNTVNQGLYMVSVLWSDQHIPGSPFKLKVFEAPDASKVKAYGPGFQNGVLGDKGKVVGGGGGGGGGQCSMHWRSGLNTSVLSLLGVWWGTMSSVSVVLVLTEYECFNYLHPSSLRL